MTQEEIKKTWEDASRKIFRPTPEEFENMYRKKKVTALERLASSYRRFSIFGLLMSITSIFWMFAHFTFVNETMRYVVSVSLMVYFAICFFLDHWLYMGVSSINCYEMPVKEVIEKALYYRKKHLQSVMFLGPCAVLVFGVLAYAFSFEKYVLIGMVAGAVIGLVFGSLQLKEFMDEYKVISKD